MNSQTSGSWSNSLDAVNLEFDSVGGQPRRPCDPKMLPILMAETEKIKRYEAERQQRELKKKRAKKNGKRPSA